MPAKKGRYRRLKEEDWGSRVHRAYRQQREETGRVYDEIANLISEVGYPVSHTSLQRLEREPEPPDRKSKRITAYLALKAYGFNPAEFDITEEGIPQIFRSAEVADLLFRSSACISISAA